LAIQSPNSTFFQAFFLWALFPYHPPVRWVHHSVCQPIIVTSVLIPCTEYFFVFIAKYFTYKIQKSLQNPKEMGIHNSVFQKSWNCLFDIFICLCCYNTKEWKFTAHSIESEKGDERSPVWEGCSPLPRWRLLLYPHLVDGKEGANKPFVKALIPSTRVESLMV
jgi:hypothetical protein